MAGEFWLSDREWTAIEPLLPKQQPGAHRVDDQRVLNGILRMLKTGRSAMSGQACRQA